MARLWFDIACQFPHERYQCHHYPYHCRFHPRKQGKRKPRCVPHEFLVYRAQMKNTQSLNLRRIFIHEDMQRVSREQKIRFMQMWFGKKSVEHLVRMTL
jgi:hypothetical protein